MAMRTTWGGVVALVAEMTSCCEGDDHVPRGQVGLSWFGISWIASLRVDRGGLITRMFPLFKDELLPLAWSSGSSASN